VTYIHPFAFAAMVIAALFLPAPADRFRGALGLPAFLLGVASLPSLPAFRGPSLTVWISAALLLLGPALLLLAAWHARLTLRSPAAWIAGAAALVAVAAAWPTLRLGGVLPALLTAGALGMGGLLLWMLAGLVGVGRAVRWLDARLPALHGRYTWGTLFLVTAAMLIWVAWLVEPLIVLSWQPIGVGVGVLAAWWAVGTRRAPLALAGAALAASFAISDGVVSGWLMLVVAALADRMRPRVAAVAAAAGGWLVVPALLGAEVVFTVLLTAAATALLGGLASDLPEATTPSR
jgi:hypothetical protein